jgi:hypothetical protein
MRPFTFGAGAGVADVGVNAISEIDRRRILRQIDNVAARSEGENLVGRKVELERIEKAFGVVFGVALQFENEAQPAQLVAEVLVGRVFFLVAPVRRNAELGFAVHFARANLHFNRLAGGPQHFGVQRLVIIRLRFGDVIEKHLRHLHPLRMHHTQGVVTVGHRRADDAQRDQVMQVVELAPLLDHLLINGVKVLGTPGHFRGNAFLPQPLVE